MRTEQGRSSREVVRRALSALGAGWLGPRGLRRLAGLGVLAALLALAVGACDEEIAPVPPKSVNQPPETYLFVQADTLAPLLYKVALSWLGSDPDGRVESYLYRWICTGLDNPPCPAPGGWLATTATSRTFYVYVPGDTGRYTFELAAVDNEGTSDATPSSQRFVLYNTRPVVSFLPGTLPVSSLPAITFYLDAIDPDSTADSDDADSRTDLYEYRAWLDGHEDQAKVVPYSAGSVTFGPADFSGDFRPRTVYVQAIDNGGAVSATIEHTWNVVAPPVDGILLVDDCRMGGFYEGYSDSSYRRVLQAAAPGRYAVLDIETIPRLSSQDLEATLSLFDRVVWYTDADTVSSGALELARGGLDALLARHGHLFLSSGLAFGTHAAFGDQEARFRDWFGIEAVYRGPDGSTNFSVSLEDTVRAAVQPGLQELRFLVFGLRAIMECFGSRRDAATQSLYYYPESTFVRGDSLHPFVNPVQFDVGVWHQLAGGGGTVYVSLPIGVPINDNVGENEVEIREMLKLAGILGP